MTQVPPPVIQPSGAMMRPHRGVMILVFGILAWFFCSIFGIVAWVMGNADLAEMEAGRMDPTGQGLTQAGRIVGMINVILAIAGIVLGILAMIAVRVFGAFASQSGGSP